MYTCSNRAVLYLQVANAIKASLPRAAIKGTKEGTKSIQVDIAPTSSRISRNAVTSMSIRGHRWKRNGENFILTSINSCRTVTLLQCV